MYLLDFEVFEVHRQENTVYQNNCDDEVVEPLVADKSNAEVPDRTALSEYVKRFFCAELKN